MSYLHRVCRLAGNGVRFRLLKHTGRAHRLETLSLEITHRCICRCRMCNIWKIPAQVPDLEISEYLKLLSSPEARDLRELDLTGGEPFLRGDLGEFVREVCALQPRHFPSLRTLSITTNAILTDRVLQGVRESIGALQARGIDLVLACGVDAAGELHDRIRNYPGAWRRFQQTLAGLRQIRQEYPNLILGLKTTIVPANVQELEAIASFAEENGLFTIISPCIVTANRFGNLDRAEELKFSSEDLDRLVEFYESPRFAWSGHREALLGYLKTGRISKPCTAGFNTLFIRHNGEAFACPVIPQSLGNIREHSLKDIFFNSAADHFRKKVGSFSECQVCTEPGMERIARPLEGFGLLKLLAKRGGREFDSLVLHMGLDKFL